MSAMHLIKRFFGSVSASALSADETVWVNSRLLPGEQLLWDRMSTPDQRHAYGVGQRVVELLRTEATRPVIAAALLHDIGKVDASLGTFTRSLATLAGQQATPAQIESWGREKGWLGRAGRYLRHNEIGAEMLRAAGSDPLTITWAREHELVHTEWTLPGRITDALWRADNH